MARGWESKSVEEQQAENSSAPTTGKARLNAAEAAIARQRNDLHMRRKMILQRLQTASGIYRVQMEAALKDLEQQLEKLGQGN